MFVLIVLFCIAVLIGVVHYAEMEGRKTSKQKALKQIKKRLDKIKTSKSIIDCHDIDTEILLNKKS